MDPRMMKNPDMMDSRMIQNPQMGPIPNPPLLLKELIKYFNI